MISTVYLTVNKQTKQEPSAYQPTGAQINTIF